MGNAGAVAVIYTQYLLVVSCGKARPGQARPGKELIHFYTASHLGFSNCPHPHFPCLMIAMQHVVPAAAVAQKCSISISTEHPPHWQ